MFFVWDFQTMYDDWSSHAMVQQLSDRYSFCLQEIYFVLRFYHGSKHGDSAMWWSCWNGQTETVRIRTQYRCSKLICRYYEEWTLSSQIWTFPRRFKTGPTLPVHFSFRRMHRCSPAGRSIPSPLWILYILYDFPLNFRTYRPCIANRQLNQKKLKHKFTIFQLHHIFNYFLFSSNKSFYW